MRHFTGVLSTATSRASPCCCCLRATFLIVSRSYCRITVLKPQKDWLHALPSQSHHHTLSKGVTESYFQLESSSDLSTESCHCRLHLNFKFSPVTPKQAPSQGTHPSLAPGELDDLVLTSFTRQRFVAALIPQMFGNSIPGHTTRVPQVGFELATYGIQFYHLLCHWQLGQGIHI